MCGGDERHAAVLRREDGSRFLRRAYFIADYHLCRHRARGYLYPLGARIAVEHIYERICHAFSHEKLAARIDKRNAPATQFYGDIAQQRCLTDTRRRIYQCAVHSAAVMYERQNLIANAVDPVRYAHGYRRDAVNARERVSLASRMAADADSVAAVKQDISLAHRVAVGMYRILAEKSERLRHIVWRTVYALPAENRYVLPRRRYRKKRAETQSYFRDKQCRSRICRDIFYYRRGKFFRQISQYFRKRRHTACRVKPRLYRATHMSHLPCLLKYMNLSALLCRKRKNRDKLPIGESVPFMYYIKLISLRRKHPLLRFLWLR